MAFVDHSFMESPEWVDFDQFLNLPSGYDDQSTATTISPQDMALPYEGNFTSPVDLAQPSFDMNYDLQEDFMGMDGGFVQDPAAPLFDDASFVGYNPYDSSNAFRSMVEVQAAADPRIATAKEKRREAAIALHLQRLCDATALDLDMSSDSNTSFSSPSWSDYVRESTSPRPSPTNTVAEAPPPGAMEMVLDLNMNAASNVPKKQKPRSQAQKENYIKARKFGACEKHKKQHKRCNCLEKAAARAAAGDFPTPAVSQDRPRHPVPQASVSLESRYSMSPGDVPSNQPQALPALPSVKAIRKPTSSSGHDVLIRLPVVPQDAARKKSQQSTPPGRDTGHPRVSNLDAMYQNMVVQSGKLVAKNTDLATTKIAPPGKNVANHPSAGHDILISGKLGKSVGHDRLLSSKVANTAGIDQGHDPCQSAQHARPSRMSDGSSLRCRVSTGVAHTPRPSNVPPTVSQAIPAVRQQTARSTVPGTVVPGSIAGNLGIHPALPYGVRALEERTSRTSVAANIQSVPKNPKASPSRLGLGVSGNHSPLLVGNGIVHSLARVGDMLSDSVTAVCASVSSVPEIEHALFKGLSLAGRYFMSARKTLSLFGLRT